MNHIPVYTHIKSGKDNQFYQMWIDYPSIPLYRLEIYSWFYKILKNGDFSKKQTYVDIKYSLLNRCEHCFNVYSENKCKYRTVTSYIKQIGTFSESGVLCIDCFYKALNIQKSYLLISKIKKEIKSENRNIRAVKGIPVQHAGGN